MPQFQFSFMGSRIEGKNVQTFLCVLIDRPAWNWKMYWSLYVIVFSIMQMFLLFPAYLFNLKWPPGVLELFFDGVCSPRSENPTYISKDFSHSKNGWLDSFCWNFRKSRPISKGFSASKTASFTIFFAIFVKWDPPLSMDFFFLTQMGPMSKDFWWHRNLFGRHIPVCLNMWVSPLEEMTYQMINRYQSSIYRHRGAQSDPQPRMGKKGTFAHCLLIF